MALLHLAEERIGTSLRAAEARENAAVATAKKNASPRPPRKR